MHKHFSRLWGTAPIKRKRHLTVSNIAKCLYFCGFPDILFIPFVSIKRFTFPYTHLQIPIPAGT